MRQVARLSGEQNRTRAVVLCVEIATSEDQPGLMKYQVDLLRHDAIVALANDTGEEGLAAARRLYETDAVPDPGTRWPEGSARDYLQHLAELHGWTKR